MIVLASSNSLAIKCFAISPDKPSPSPLTSRYASSFQDMEKAVAILTQGVMAALSNSPVQLWASPATGELPWQLATGAKGLKISPAFQSDFKSNFKLWHSMGIAFAGILNHSHIVSSLKAPVFTTLEDLASEGEKLSSCVSPWFTYVSLLLLDPICSVFSCPFSSLSKCLRSKLSLCTSSWGCKLP